MCSFLLFFVLTSCPLKFHSALMRIIVTTMPNCLTCRYIFGTWASQFRELFFIRASPPRRVTLAPPRSKTRLIVVTATYKAAAQIAQLVRLKQTLQLLQNCDWIVVHNLAKPNTRVLRYIRDFDAGLLHHSYVLLPF